MNEKKTVSLGLGGWMTIQCVLFIIHYGFDKNLPMWVSWFPSMIIAGAFILTLLIVGIILLIAWIKDKR